MDRHDTWKLYEKGPCAWNRWADCMLTKRNDLIRSGQWEAHGADWEEEAKADFSHREIASSPPGLKHYIFPAGVDFSSVIFHGQVGFKRPCLRGRAHFDGSVFKEMAYFGKLRFAGPASFRSCTFKGIAHFGGAKFAARAGFAGVRAMNQFDLTEARFRTVPDFSGAEFAHAPRLDGTHFDSYRIPELSRLWKPRRDDSLSSIDGAATTESHDAVVTNETGRWRTLRYHASDWGDFPMSIVFSYVNS